MLALQLLALQLLALQLLALQLLAAASPPAASSPAASPAAASPAAASSLLCLCDIWPITVACGATRCLDGTHVLTSGSYRVVTYGLMALLGLRVRVHMSV